MNAAYMYDTLAGCTTIRISLNTGILHGYITDQRVIDIPSQYALVLITIGVITSIELDQDHVYYRFVAQNRRKALADINNYMQMERYRLS
jgi:hypothetical protein